MYSICTGTAVVPHLYRICTAVLHLYCCTAAVPQDELDSREVVAQYVCKAPHCNKEFTSFDMPDLVTFDGSLKCTMCGGNVEQVGACRASACVVECGWDVVRIVRANGAYGDARIWLFEGAEPVSCRLVCVCVCVRNVPSFAASAFF